mmetsp:Transcript_3206/g.7803  ORF Transcript_3206/g.7803 Transcript_3206/m.7803 type:complete len:598 (+) Transcript_3206:76-1869(+)
MRGGGGLAWVGTALLAIRPMAVAVGGSVDPAVGVYPWSKLNVGDPYSVENFVYEACDADGHTACGMRPRAELKMDANAAVAQGATVHLRDLRDPDGWVERVPAESMDPDTFYHEYVLKHRPVVLVNATAGWGANSKWSDAYIKQRLQGYRLRMETKDDDKYNIPDGMSADEFFSSYNTTRGLYLVDELPPALHSDVGVPGFMHCDDITQMFFVSYLWVSAGGTASQGHVDTDENLLYVVRGQKVLTLVSPVFSTSLHADDTRAMGVLDQNFAQLNLAEWPRYTSVRYLHAEVNAGDGVYLPQNWWHQVNSTRGHQLGVATWWKSRPEQRAVPEGSDPVNAYFRGRDLKLSYGTVLENYARSVLTDPERRATCRVEPTPKTMADYEFATDREDFVKEGNAGDWLESQGDDTKGTRDETHWCPYNLEDPRAPCYFNGCLQFATDNPEYRKISRKVMQRDLKDPDYRAVLQETQAQGGGTLPAPPQDGPGGGGISYRCLRYIMDYCHAPKTNDPQCWVELSNLLTKVTQPELEILRRKRSEVPRPGVLTEVPAWGRDAQRHFEEEREESRKEWTEMWARRHAKERTVDEALRAEAIRTDL